MRKTAILAAVAIAAASLTGCSSVKKDATYDSPEDLRQAVIKSGGNCPGETVMSNDDGGSIKCSSDLMLEIINDKDMLALAGVVASLTGGSHSLLTGPNWAIHGTEGELSELKGKLGGELTVP